MPLTLISRLRSSVYAFPLAALAALAMLVISEASYRDASNAIGSLGERGQARIELQTLRVALYQAESAQRGFLLTDRPEYLVSYRASLPVAQAAIAALSDAYRDDPDSAELVKRLASVTDAKFSELAETIQYHDEGKADLWRELVLSNIGKEKMEEARALSDRLLTRENSQILIGRQGVVQTLMLNRIGVAAMTAVSLLALFMYLRRTSELDHRTLEESIRVADERDRLENEVATRTAQLRELAQHLQTIREDERSHLARELHDELGALLTAAKLDAARLKSRLGAAAPEVLTRLAHLNDTLNSGIALKRRIIEDLRPSSLSNLGLVAALEILLREFASRSDIAVASDLFPVELDPACELTVYRLVQEALTNVAKYAKARKVTVTLAPEGIDQARVAVEDDGVGFDTALPRASTHGLLGMRYRVEAEGGTMKLRSAPGQGTVIEALLPVHGAGEDEPQAAASDSPMAAAA
ncbi:MAG: CHASE3 domain-containing protein [Caldimonas sp.]